MVMAGGRGPVTSCPSTTVPGQSGSFGHRHGPSVSSGTSSGDLSGRGRVLTGGHQKPWLGWYGKKVYNVNVYPRKTYLFYPKTRRREKDTNLEPLS